MACEAERAAFVAQVAKRTAISGITAASDSAACGNVHADIRDEFE
jgi:hypothetical protein